MEAPVEGYYHCRNSFVYEAKHIFSDGAFDSLSVIDFSDHELLCEYVKNRIQTGAYDLPASGQRLDVLFCKAGAGNYGHFLTECAPRLLNLQGQALGPLRLHMPVEAANYASLITALCNFLGLDVELRIGNTADLVYLERFIYLSSISSHNTKKSRTFSKFRDVILAMLGVQQTYSRRFAIKRGHNEQRKVSNWDDLTPHLSKLGYECIQPGKLTFKEQVSLFASADRIFGSLGAGFTNCMWAGSECMPLMLDPGLADFFFWDISGQLCQQFHWQFCGVAQPWSLELATTDFAAPVDLTLQVLDQLQ
ncbi:glycosyltransferase family 61 protein [Ensifer sp. LC163]|uniref:glycosyltransferase family 61 protein n=1 Tax=Ensifer sp. LC163 TaxID=1120652 RepID=UPI0013747889|nr:glycosyltransferase family 61 protein [Ensifer sp. LC163]